MMRVTFHDATNYTRQFNDGTNDAEEVNGNSKAHNVKSPAPRVQTQKESKKSLHRKQRGLMQWKPMRNLQFAKDEAKFAVKKTTKKFKLQGRQHDVETETTT